MVSMAGCFCYLLIFNENDGPSFFRVWDFIVF
jgi:hypothetical protein